MSDPVSASVGSSGPCSIDNPNASDRSTSKGSSPIVLNGHEAAFQHHLQQPHQPGRTELCNDDYVPLQHGIDLRRNAVPQKSGVFMGGTQKQPEVLRTALPFSPSHFSQIAHDSRRTNPLSFINASITKSVYSNASTSRSPQRSLFWQTVLWQDITGAQIVGPMHDSPLCRPDPAKAETSRPSKRSRFWDTVLYNDVCAVQIVETEQNLPQGSRESLPSAISQVPNRAMSAKRANNSGAPSPLSEATPMNRSECSTRRSNRESMSGENRRVRQFKCDQCSFMFFTKGHRTQHIRYVHYKIRPFPCKNKDCESRFTSQYALNQVSHQCTREGVDLSIVITNVCVAYVDGAWGKKALLVLVSRLQFAVRATVAFNDSRKDTPSSSKGWPIAQIINEALLKPHVVVKSRILFPRAPHAQAEEYCVPCSFKPKESQYSRMLHYFLLASWWALPLLYYRQRSLTFIFTILIFENYHAYWFYLVTVIIESSICVSRYFRQVNLLSLFTTKFHPQLEIGSIHSVQQDRFWVSSN